MAKKIITPEPIQDAIPASEITTLAQASEAIKKTRQTVEFRIAKNRREAAILDRAQIQLNLVLLMLDQVNTLQREPERNA